MALSEGKMAPDFTLPASGGGEVTLSTLRGRKVVIYFYPRDATPGCTKEACSFRDQFAELRAAGAEILGISKDSIASHEKFKSQNKLPFPLASDADNRVATAYGAYGRKMMYGKPVTGTIRST